MKPIPNFLAVTLALAITSQAFALTTFTERETAKLSVAKNFALRPCAEHFTEAFFCATKTGPLIVVCQGMAGDSDEVYWQITDARKVISRSAIDKSNESDGLTLDDEPEHFIASENRRTPEEINVFSQNLQGFSITWTDSGERGHKSSFEAPSATAVFHDGLTKKDYECSSASIRQNLTILNK